MRVNASFNTQRTWDIFRGLFSPTKRSLVEYFDVAVSLAVIQLDSYLRRVHLSSLKVLPPCRFDQVTSPLCTGGKNISLNRSHRALYRDCHLVCYFLQNDVGRPRSSAW